MGRGPIRVWLDEDGIDPSLAFLDGRVFYTRNGRGADPDHPFVYQGELTLAGGPPIVVEPRVIWRGTGGIWPEAPHLYRRGGWYYLVAAEGGTSYGHSVVVARGTDPYGPFEPSPARAAAHAPRPAPAADPGDGARRPRRPRGRHDLGRAAGDPTARRQAPPPRSRDVPRTRPLGRRRMAADVARQGSARGTGSRAGPRCPTRRSDSASGPGAFPRAGSSSGTPLAAAAPSGNDRDSCGSGEPRRRSATSPRRRSSADASSTSRRPRGCVSSSSP